WSPLCAGRPRSGDRWPPSLQAFTVGSQQSRLCCTTCQWECDRTQLQGDLTGNGASTGAQRRTKGAA
ncbi:hypothetical protein M514_04848, partial [Trichuris suis]